MREVEVGTAASSPGENESRAEMASSGRLITSKMPMPLCRVCLLQLLLLSTVTAAAPAAATQLQY